MRVLVSILIPACNVEECVGGADHSGVVKSGTGKRSLSSMAALPRGLWQSRGNLSRKKLWW
jgi:hypothetical protein